MKPRFQKIKMCIWLYVNNKSGINKLQSVNPDWDFSKAIEVTESSTVEREISLIGMGKISNEKGITRSEVEKYVEEVIWG